ncbi:hypothetical protein LZ554_005576 [Drepanopeziza brunnea f. sp. 'monogermtubi']|nr:hypothetical protein LZ554_005576 [Drepanopeziza brunnea f. sp. 'monogermtubi']
MRKSKGPCARSPRPHPGPLEAYLDGRSLGNQSVLRDLIWKISESALTRLSLDDNINNVPQVAAELTRKAVSQTHKLLNDQYEAKTILRLFDSKRQIKNILEFGDKFEELKDLDIRLKLRFRSIVSPDADDRSAEVLCEVHVLPYAKYLGLTTKGLNNIQIRTNLIRVIDAFATDVLSTFLIHPNNQSRTH